MNIESLSKIHTNSVTLYQCVDCDNKHDLRGGVRNSPDGLDAVAQCVRCGRNTEERKTYPYVYTRQAILSLELKLKHHEETIDKHTL